MSRLFVMQWSQCGHGDGVEAVGGWRFGNTINGAGQNICWSRMREPICENLDELSDEQVVFR
jgi:hypothetical protein